MKVRTALVVGVGIVLSLFSTDSLWAGPTPERVSSSRWSWLRIAFTDTETDFVPPPPRDESAEEGEVAEPLFEGAEPLEEQFEEQVAEDLIGGDRPPIDLRDREPAVEHPFPLAQPRDHFDPGFTQDADAAESWQVMPSGLMYRSYLAGEKESRMSSVWAKDQTGRTVWESTLGGRVGLLRHGTTGADRPQGWQLDFEGAALVRVLPGTDSTMLEAVDYRAGFLSTWAFDNWHVKAGYSHFCAHLGDEYVIAYPLIHRFNYVRDSVVLGVTYDINSDWQAYGEIAYALSAEDGAEPLELQYGLQYSPLVYGLRGAPFAAVNGHSRQDFGGITSVNCQAGWQWRGTDSQHLWRMGLQYYTGPALQYAFPGSQDHLLGGGLWFDY